MTNDERITELWLQCSDMLDELRDTITREVSLSHARRVEIYASGLEDNARKIRCLLEESQ